MEYDFEDKIPASYTKSVVNCDYDAGQNTCRNL